MTDDEKLKAAWKRHDVENVLGKLTYEAGIQFREGCEAIGALGMVATVQQLVHQSSIQDTADLLNALAAGLVDDALPLDGTDLKDPLAP